MVRSSSFELLKAFKIVQMIIQRDGDSMIDPVKLEFQILIAGAFQISALTAWRHLSEEQ
jgi:hypothetical protein